MFLIKANTLFVFFAHNDPLRFLQHHTKQRTDSGRTGSDDQHRIIFCNLGNMCRPIACSQNISYQQSLPVSNLIRNFVKPLICKRHPHVLCLTSVYAAAKSPAPIFIRAIINIAFFTEKAFPTKSFHVYRYSVSRSHICYTTSNFFYNSYHLMTNCYPRNRTWNTSMFDMKVT